MYTVTNVLAVCGVLWLAACTQRGAGQLAQPPSLGVADLFGGTASDAAGFARATAPPDLVFPRDHGAHPAFRTEWWYVTANLVADGNAPFGDGGRRFGVQLVFFRQALAPDTPGAAPRPASFAAREVILAHAAVTDVDGKRFHCEQRLARAAAGVGEVRGGGGPDDPFSLRCADWSARAEDGSGGFLPLSLQAEGSEFAFTLHVEAGKPIVLQGDRGLSQKSDEPGNASIYYSMTRLPIWGFVSTDRHYRVRGEAWLDREWSTSALGPDQVGWDWFSLQLDDGTEVMWYRLRRRDGSVDPWSRGCLVARDGSVTPLSPAAVDATPDGEWRASDGGTRYPARWRLRCSSPAFDLEVEPLLPDQELRLLVRYWEGAVTVRGTRDGAPVTGRGYLEMTGYAGAR